MASTVRTRFAPSPTGYLHLGGARTALFNWLFARQSNGTFVLRVEDTDDERNTEEAVAAIYSGMEWLGLDWDEGHGKGGDYGPYSQSERHDLYLKWFDKLRADDRVYQEDDGAWRFRFARKEVTMTDLVCGEVTIDYKNEEINPDMTIRRPDGSFTFHFVNVVDDHEMQISHVIRGEDHLMNTPKHLQLYEAFGVEPPVFAHIPLILNEGGKKMSKRDEGASVRDYVEDGFLPAAAVNLISLLGWNPKSEQEIFSLEELVEIFDLANVNRAPARFDLKKALWVNQQYLGMLSEEEFVGHTIPFLEKAGIPADAQNLESLIIAAREKVSTLCGVQEFLSFFYNEQFPYDEGALEKVQKNEEVPALLGALRASWAGLSDWSEAKDQIGETAKAQGSKPGKLMFPTRVALSGLGGGIDLGVIIASLGQEQCVARIDRYLSEQA